MSLHAALDSALEGQWLASRDAGFGCSDLGALWVALGWVSDEDMAAYEEHTFQSGLVERAWRVPRYMAEAGASKPKILVPAGNGRRRFVPSGRARIFEEKAGRLPPKGGSGATREGKAKEALLFRHSRLAFSGVYAPEATALPERWRPQVVHESPGRWVLSDTVEPRLLCTLEAWEEGPDGLVVWELKTDRLGTKTSPTWYWMLQVFGAAAVLGASLGGVVYGPGWAMTDDPAFPDLPEPRVFRFEVSEEQKMMVRQAVRLGWAKVEEARHGGHHGHTED